MRYTGIFLSLVVGFSIVIAAGGCQCGNDDVFTTNEPIFQPAQGEPQPCLKADASDLTPCASGVIDFGNVPVKTSVQKEITIGNVGNAALEF